MEYYVTIIFTNYLANTWSNVNKVSLSNCFVNQLFSILNWDDKYTYLKKLLISRAPVEHLLNENFLVWVREFCNKLISVWVNRSHDRVESFDARDTVLNKFGKFHFVLN